MTTPLDKAEGVSRLALDGRTWLEWAAEWHDAQSEHWFHLVRAAHERGDTKLGDAYAELHNNHMAMSQACREAMG